MSGVAALHDHRWPPHRERRRTGRVSIAPRPGLTGRHDAAVGENDLDGYEVVADQAILGGCPAVAAAVVVKPAGRRFSRE